MKAIVDGQEVSVGDWVGFKSDIEQSGQIVEIKKTVCFGVSLVLQNNNGFHGDYIGGSTITTELARDCWIDG
jgi:transcription elongation factor